MIKLRALDELQAMALDWAQHALIGEAGAQLPPTWWVQFDNRPGEMIVSPWSDEAEKLAVVEMIRTKLKDPHARNYAFVAEVWVAEEDAMRPSRLPPSQHPNRREVVMTHAFNRNGKGGLKVYRIKRNGEGVVTALPEDKEVKGGRFQGRMFNLFRDERTQHAVVPRSKPIVKDRARTTRTPPSHCLDCGYAINAGSPTPDFPNASPEPGDVAICLKCAHLMVYADDLTVRALTGDEVVEVAGDPEIVRAVNAIAELNKRERQHG